MRRWRWVVAGARPLGAPLLAASLIVIGVATGVVIGVDRAATREAGDRSLLRDLDACPFDVGLAVGRTVSIAPDGSAGRTRPTVAALTGALVSAMAGRAPPATVTLFGGVVDLVSDKTGKRTPVQLISRTGADAHVVSTGDGSTTSGVIVQLRESSQLGLAVGQSVHFGNDASSRSTVGRIIEDLNKGGFSNFWCSLNPQIYGSTGAVEAPMVIVDQATLIDLATRSGKSDLFAAIEFAPLRSSWSLQTAPAVLAQFHRVQQAAKNDLDPLGQAIATDGGAQVDRLNTIETAGREMVAAAGVIAPFTAWAIVVLMLCAVLCSILWVRQSERGRRVLVRHGMGAREILVVMLVEMAPAAVLAGLLGLVGRWVALRHWNGGERHPWSSVMSPSIPAGLVALSPLIVVVAFAGLHSWTLTRARHVRRPWLVVTMTACLLIGAAASLSAYRTRFDSAMRRHVFTGEDFLSALAPVVLAVVVPLLLVSDLITDRVGARRGRFARTVWLAWMRVRGDRPVYRVAVVCLASAMTFVGVLGISTSTVAKATRVRSTIGLGASVVYTLDDEPPATVAASGDVTVVTRVREPTVLAGAKPPVDVLGVDPATFARAAVWQDNFSVEGLNALLDRLDRSEDPNAALVIGAGVPDRFTVTLEGERTSVELELHAVARPALFPSEDPSADRPLVVVNRSLLVNAHVAGGIQLWTARRGPLSPSAIAELGTSLGSRREAFDESVTGAVSVQNALDNARILAVILLIVVSVTFAGTSRYARRESARRERALLGTSGLSKRRVVIVSAASVGIIGVVALVCGVATSILVNVLMPHLTDQTPYLVVAPGRTWVLAPALISLGCIIVAAAVAAIGAASRLRPTARYADLTRHG